MNTLKNSKNVDFDCIMKAFFDERNKYYIIWSNLKAQKKKKKASW